MEVKIIKRPAFTIAGKKVWITGRDNEQFGRFWKQCNEDGLFQTFGMLRDRHQFGAGGPQTGAALLGVSCIEGDAANRAFFYFIAIELPALFDQHNLLQFGLNTIRIPGGTWAVFSCHGKVPESIMKSEMYAFEEWLPASAYLHAGSFEMEVYPPDGDETYIEFWMQVKEKSR